MPPPSPPKFKPRASWQRSKADSPRDQVSAAHICIEGGSRKRATQARARETVDAILEAASSLLEKEGYRAASTNAIARRAGVSVGSLYQYFSSREDIFRTLQAHHHNRIHPIIDAALARLLSEKTRPSSVLSDLLRDLLAAHAGRPALMHAMESELAHLLPAKAASEEAKEAEKAIRLMASRIQSPREQALASAWLAGEITATLSRKLAHSPPGWVDMDQVQAAFNRAMRALVG
jgi:AcrR family transcriptional regulator